MNNPAGMSQDELLLLASTVAKALPRGQKDRRGSKPKLDRAKRRQKNRQARKARARNRA